MKKINFFIILAITLVTSLQLFAQNIEVKTLDKYFAKAQKDWNVVGMSVGIIKDGEIVLSKGYGELETGKGNAPDGNSLYAIASNTKAFISTAIGILVDEGKVNWDDPVKKHLPWFEMYDPYVTNHITVRDLLCHRAGLGTFSGDVIWYKSDYTAEEAIRHLKYLKPAYEFRSGYGYSNLMFITAGEVIKAVSGKPWTEFVKERVFNPLGMERTRTSVTELSQMKNVATPHKPDLEDVQHTIPWVNWDNMGAAGGIISSTNDMLKWCQLQIDGGKIEENSIFSLKAQETFWKPHNNFTVSARTKKTYPNRHVSGYALGWSYFDYEGRMVYNHGGGYDGMYSKVLIVPEENLAMVVLTNSMKGISNALMYYTLDRYFGLEEKDWSTGNLERTRRWEASKGEDIDKRIQARLKDTKPTLMLDDYAGIYHDDLFGDIEIVNKGGSLEINFLTAKALNAKLQHWHNDVFQIKWKEEHAWFDFGTLQFVLDNNLKPKALQFDVPNGDIFFEEIEAARKDD